MPAHKTTVTVAADHQVVVRLPDDFPPGEAEVVVTPRPAASATRNAVAAFDESFSSLPVVSLESLDRGLLSR